MGAIAPSPPLQGGPRDDIYLFKIKYSFEKLDSKEIQTLYSGVALSIISDFSACLTFCQFS